jgi:hypothetical protein
MTQVLVTVASGAVAIWGTRQALKLKDELRERWDVWRVDRQPERASGPVAQVLPMRRAQ